MKNQLLLILSILTLGATEVRSQSSFFDDFTDSVGSQWKVDEAYTATIDNGAMKVEINKQAGQELQTLTLEFPESLDLLQTPYFSVKIKANAKLLINPVFVDENGRIADADIFDGTGDPFNTYDTGDDFLEKEFSTTNLSGVDWANSAWPPNAFYPVDFTKIKQLSFLINHNDLATGTIWIDDLKVGTVANQHGKTACFNSFNNNTIGNWDNAGIYTVSPDNGSLKIKWNKNSSNLNTGLALELDTTLDLTKTPFLSVRIKANSAITFDPVFEDADGHLSDGDRFSSAVVGDEITTLGNGKFTNYNFCTTDFTGVDWAKSGWPPNAFYNVDFSRIKKVIFLINQSVQGIDSVWIDDLAVGSITPEAQKSINIIPNNSLSDWLPADGFRLSYDSTLDAVQIAIDKSESNKYSAFGLSILPPMSFSEHPYIQIIAKSSNGVILDPLFEDVYGLAADGDRPATQDEQMVTADGFKTYNFSTTQFEAVDWSQSSWPPDVFMPVDFDFIHKIVLLTNHGVVEKDTIWIKSIAIGKIAKFSADSIDFTYLHEAIDITSKLLEKSLETNFKAGAKATLTEAKNKAKTTLDDENATQEMVDNATAELHNAIETFRTSVKNNFTATGRFYVDGKNIIDPNGNIFIARGVNAHGCKYGWSGNWLDDLDEITKAWQFNLVRINCRITNATWNGEDISAQSPWQTVQEMDDVIKALTANGIVAMIDYHDATGDYFTGDLLEQLKDQFRYLCDTYKDNPYVWFNIANEPGGMEKNIAPWLHEHQEVIKVIRDEKDADNLIVVDGIYWAQEFDEWNDQPINESNTAILAHGNDILNFEGKQYGNIVFSIHNYDKLNVGKGDGNISQDIVNDKLADLIQRIQNKNYALIIGEYGTAAQLNSFDNLFFPLAFNASIKVSSLMNVGRVWWAWGGFDALDLTTLGNGGGRYIDHWFAPQQLTWAGSEIFTMTHWYLDIDAPSKPELTVKSTSANSITIDIKGARDNVEVIGYKIYVNGEFFAYSPNQEYTLAGLVNDQEYGIQVSAVDYANNESALSAEVKIAPGKTGIHDSRLSDVKIYPNPLNSNLHINGLEGYSNVELVNTNGQIVYSNHLTENDLIIDVSSFPAGVYMVKVKMGNGIYTEKVMKTSH